MNFFRVLFQKNVPRWIIFSIDVVICFVSLILAFLVRFNFKIPEVEIEAFPLVFGMVIGVRIISFLISKTYKGIVKYTSSKDSQRILGALTVGSLFFVVINLIFYFFVNGL